MKMNLFDSKMLKIMLRNKITLTFDFINKISLNRMTTFNDFHIYFTFLLFLDEQVFIRQ